MLMTRTESFKRQKAENNYLTCKCNTAHVTAEGEVFSTDPNLEVLLTERLYYSPPLDCWLVRAHGLHCTVRYV